MATLYWGRGSSSHQTQQKQSCQRNLQMIHLALQIYANDFQGVFPRLPQARTSEEALDVLVPRYSADTSIFICPGSQDASLPSGESFRTRHISYAYFMGRRISDADALLLSDQQIDTLPKSKGAPVFSATGKGPGSNHDKYGGNFLFCDGQTQTSPAEAPFAISFPTNVVLLNPKP